MEAPSAGDRSCAPLTSSMVRRPAT